jgi:glutamate racemase
LARNQPVLEVEPHCSIDRGPGAGHSPSLSRAASGLPGKMNHQVAGSDSGSIGLFDSGVGGLSVLTAIREQLPNEDLLYVADSRYAPWGDKSVEFVRRRSGIISAFLIGQGAKIVVIGSNTGTAASAELLRATAKVPIVAIEPAIKPAVAATRSGVIGVLVTSVTSQSTRFNKLLEQFGKNVRIVTQAAPGLVERIERGDLEGEETRSLLQRYLAAFRLEGADTVVLGSTHYVFLGPIITEIMGPNVLLVDSGHAVARQVAKVLREQSLSKVDTSDGDVRFWTSGDPARERAIISRLWRHKIHVDLFPEGQDNASS